MEKFVKGDIVVIPFPYSDLSNAKKRPAMVLSEMKGDDIILCQITSQFTKDEYAIVLENEDFTEGSLHKTSNIRPNRLFTAEKSIIIRKTGRISKTMFNKVVHQLCGIVRI